MMGKHGNHGIRRADPAHRIHAPRTRALFDRVPIGLYRTTLDGRFLHANPALAALLGYTDVAELLATPVTSLYMDPAQRTAQITTIEQTRAAVVDEICLRRKDGAAVWVRDTFSPVYDALGRFRYFEGSLEDVTQKYAARAAFAQSQQRLELALQSADLGMYDWNLLSGEVTISDRYATMLGYTVAEMDLSFAGWKALVHPDDLPGVLVTLERRLGDLSPPVMSEYRMRARSGEWRWIQDRAGIIERAPDGRPLRMVGFHLDITERKAAEVRAGRVNRGLWMMVQCHEAITRAKDEAGLLDQVCEVLVDVGGYGVAWGGRAEGDARRTVRLVARRGPLQHCLDDPDPPAGDGPVGAAIRTAATCHARDLATDPRFPAWRDQALAGGLQSALVLPLMQRRQVVAELGLGTTRWIRSMLKR